MKLFLFLATTLCVVILHPGDCASLGRETEDDEARMLRSLVSSPRTDEDMVVPAKRYASGYYTNLRAKHLDQAAAKKLLRMFVGKRDPTLANDRFDTLDDVTNTEGESPLQAYVILTGRLGPGGLGEYLRLQDHESQDALEY